MAPPAGAVVLFDGSSFDAWKPFSFLEINPNDDQTAIQWKLVDGEAMQIAFEFEGKRRKQFLCTREKFGDYRLHLEFLLPEKGSGNTGVFFGPLYEPSGRCTNCKSSTAPARSPPAWATAARFIKSAYPT